MNSLKKSLWKKTFDIIIKNKKILGTIILLDLLFVFGLYVLQQFFWVAAPTPSPETVGKLAFLALFYYIALIFLYSFTKQMILSYIHPLFSKGKQLRRSLNFYAVNMLLFVLLLIVIIIIGFFVLNLKESAAPWVSLLLLTLTALYFYPFVNLAQIASVQGKNVRASFRTAFLLLKQPKKVLGIFGTLLGSVGAVLILFFISGKTLEKTLFQDINALIKYGDLYTLVFVYAIGIVFYLAVLFNRFHFVQLFEKFKGK